VGQKQAFIDALRTGKFGRKIQEHYLQCGQYHRHKTIILDPKILKELGFDIQIIEQNENEIILSFSGGFHSGFTASLFSFAEAVNVSSNFWLTEGLKKAITCDCEAGYNNFGREAQVALAQYTGMLVIYIIRNFYMDIYLRWRKKGVITILH
jgi:hypothetical protein